MGTRHHPSRNADGPSAQLSPCTQVGLARGAFCGVFVPWLSKACPAHPIAAWGPHPFWQGDRLCGSPLGECFQPGTQEMKARDGPASCWLAKDLPSLAGASGWLGDVCVPLSSRAPGGCFGSRAKERASGFSFGRSLLPGCWHSSSGGAVPEPGRSGAERNRGFANSVLQAAGGLFAWEPQEDRALQSLCVDILGSLDVTRRGMSQVSCPLACCCGHFLPSECF